VGEQNQGIDPLHSFARPSVLLAFLLLLIASPATASPARVMSLNVCTDQLVLALADPAQIVSLSALSDEPSLSSMHAAAAAFPKNRGLAEEVFVAKPDVVVTGVYSLHNTTQLLKHLGIAVEEFDYTQTLETIPAEIRRMGAILGKTEKAEALASGFEKELAALTVAPGPDAPRIISYGQNGVALGSGTLADSVMRAAGFRNLAAEHGYSGMTPFPLELLIEERPEIVLLSRPYADKPSLADQFIRHPAIATLGSAARIDVAPPGSWSCAGPSTIEALRALSRLRVEIGARPREATQ
jgi:iron complex transport system substrate-binding protein